MKNSVKLKVMRSIAGIIALAVVIGLSMTGCREPDDSTVTLTSITAVYNQTAAVYPNTPLNNLKADLTVTAKYSDNTTKDVTDYILSGALTIGASAVIVTYTEDGITKTVAFNVTVTAAEITYTAAQTGGTDNTTDTAGIVFTFSASVDSLNLSAGDITVGGTASKGTTALSGTGTTRTLAITVNSAGTATVTIAKTGIEAGTKNVTVYRAGETAPTLTGITAVYNQTAAVYPTTPLNNLKADLTVTAKYSDNTTKDVTDYILSGALTIGAYAVIVTYTEDGITKTATFTVTVTATPAVKTLTGITLNSSAVKKNYTQNDTFDLTGLVVTANYSDGTSAAVSYTSTSPANGTSLDTAGIITVTVTYTDGTITRSNTFTITVTAVNTGTEGLAYELIDNGTAYRVRKGTVTGGAVVIPATYEGLPVTEIGSSAFSGTEITSVTIPESVTTIGSYAFSNCTSLASVTIPEGVTSIGYNAFYNCTGLTGITIPTSVTSIVSAFYNCTSLTNVTIPTSVTSIGGDAFRDCTSLTSITIPASVTTIGSSAFGGCTGLTEIIIPEGVTSIGTEKTQSI